MKRMLVVVFVAGLAGYGIGRWQAKVLRRPTVLLNDTVMDALIETREPDRNQRPNERKRETTSGATVSGFSLANVEAKLLTMKTLAPTFLRLGE